MSGVAGLVGSKVLDKSGAVISTDFLTGENKVVGLYFSAHWCPPCRGFTPQLADWYNKMKESDQGDRLEIVFISSDKEQASFDEYFADMPWHALPYEDRDTKEKLSKEYGVTGIPTLVFLEGPSGALITKDGRGKVTRDAEGFPWKE